MDDVFISCLNSHSDGTHSLQRIHWWASDVNFSKSVPIKKQTIHLGWPEGEYIFSKIRFLDYSLKRVYIKSSAHCFANIQTTTHNRNAISVNHLFTSSQSVYFICVFIYSSLFDRISIILKAVSIASSSNKLHIQMPIWTFMTTTIKTVDWSFKAHLWQARH